MARASNDTLGRPGLNKIIELFQENAPQYWKQFFQTDTTKETFYRFIGEGDLGPATEVNEGQFIAEDDFRLSGTLDIRPIKYAKKLGFTTESMETDQYGVVAKAGNKMGRSIVDAMEALAADVVNSCDSAAAGYTTLLGLAWASNSQTYDGGTFDNLDTTAFGAEALISGIQDLRRQKSDRGNPYEIRGPIGLGYPIGLAGSVQRVLKASGLAGTANNDANPFMASAAFKVQDLGANIRFTDDDAWYLFDLGSKNHMPMMVTRGALRTKRWDDGHRDRTFMTAIKIMAARAVSPYGFRANIP